MFPKAAGREEEKKGGKKRFLDGKFTSFLSQRIDGYRQWRPVLDTIHESVHGQAGGHQGKSLKHRNSNRSGEADAGGPKSPGGAC